MRAARALLVLTLGLVTLAGCGGVTADPDNPALAPSSPSSASLTETRCADVVVLGLRGQGQSAKGNRGMGHEVLLSADALVPRLPDGTTVRLSAVLHPARLSPTLASYDADIATGVRMVQRRMRVLASACPKTRVALIGFSEGAQVVHRALSKAATDSSQVALAVLIGDPLRDPDAGLRTVHFGTRLDGQGSNGPGPAFAPGLRPMVVEACVRRDNVCNAPLTGRVGGVSQTHKTFYEQAESVRRIADTAAAVLASG